MPKYRSLTTEELKGLEKEFIDFLVLNGITGEDWVKLKEQHLAKAEKIIDQFSDVVFEGIFRKVKYLEYRGKKILKTFQCLPDKLVMVVMEADEASDANFTDPAFIQKATTQPPKDLRVYIAEKKYTKSREEELFDLTESGCEVSDGKLFKALCLALPE